MQSKRSIPCIPSIPYLIPFSTFIIFVGKYYEPGRLNHKFVATLQCSRKMSKFGKKTFYDYTIA